MSEQVETPRWEQVALSLELAAARPSEAQQATAKAIGLVLPDDVPESVAAVLLKKHLAGVLLERLGRESEIPDTLVELEEGLGISKPAVLMTDSAVEVSAWFAARYMLMTARGLRDVQPGIGDVVTSQAWPGERRVISSIGDGGRVYMRGHPSRKAWPNHLKIIARLGQGEWAEEAATIEAALRNGASYKLMNLDRLDALQEYKLLSHMPSPEAVRALEELLESGERLEELFQSLLTQHPSLLAATVVGASGTYVIPKQRLGAEHVPDFLVLGINSLGPQWLLVEIEAARHSIVNGDGTLSGQTRHAIKQIRDWGEWITTNVAYAHSELGLHGLTNRAPSLVIIGRDEPTMERQPSRSRSGEGERIAIHSWDWVLRSARNLSATAIGFSELARHNAKAGTTSNRDAAGITDEDTW
ncbi:Shedu anti-phage system protein SduA domain-containing protein [Nocardioides sp.]|uniref:Shedu anti-phage system protein SduA domain-containing protein n=1 Tax=Nocardioides sp. TaxID=35761 RepID=UPI002CFF02CB|nr:Shedu anti-phage system protein SduA domain-containing protein [Nocardioides sp.]HXH78692.1 Shedu anti-phage system protein SduA domain-containing protein [Nocardioides sp.]